MGWTTPVNVSLDELIAVSKWNEEVNDNLKYLKGQAGPIAIEDAITAPGLTVSGVAYVMGIKVGARDITSAQSPYTMTTADVFVAAFPITAIVQIKLPAVSPGRMYIVKKATTVSTPYCVDVVTPSTAVRLDGSTYQRLLHKYETIIIISGTDRYYVAGFYNP